MSAWDDMLKRCAALNEELGIDASRFPPPGAPPVGGPFLHPALIGYLPSECSMIVCGESLVTEIDPVSDDERAAQGVKP